MSQFEYDLTVSHDTNSSGHTQWFYFCVAGAQPGVSYTFNIVNFAKPDSLFNQGQRPLLYSNKQAEAAGWVRCADNICYYKRDTLEYQTPSLRKAMRGKPVPYVLTFRVQFGDSGKQYLAYSYPYTMHDLRADLARWVTDTTRSRC